MHNKKYAEMGETMVHIHVMMEMWLQGMAVQTNAKLNQDGIALGVPM